MSKYNVIILADDALYFTPAGEREGGGDGFISISYGDNERVETFLDELEGTFTGQEFKLFIYSSEEEVDFHESPHLKPWEINVFLETHKSERFLGKENVLAKSDYLKCSDSNLIRDWIVVLEEPVYTVYASILSRKIMIVSIHAVGHAMGAVLQKVAQRRISSSFAALSRSNSKRDLVVLYDCVFLYFFVFDQCGIRFFRHATLDESGDLNSSALIVREVDLTIRYILSKGVVEANHPCSFTLIAPEPLLSNSTLNDSHTFVSLSLLSDSVTYRALSINKLFVVQDDNCGSDTPLRLINGLAAYKRLPELVQTAAGRIKSIIYPVAVLAWVFFLSVSLYYAYSVGALAKKDILLSDAEITLENQQHRLMTIKRQLEKKVDLDYDPSDMYQLVLFNKSYAKVSDAAEWDQVFVPAATIVKKYEPRAIFKELKFNEEGMSLLSKPTYQATIVVGLPLEGHALSAIYSSLEKIVRALSKNDAIENIKVIKSPFDPSLTSRLHIDVSDYDKNYYYFIVQYVYRAL